MNSTTHAPATSARNSRKVAVARRSAGNAGAIIGTSTKNGEPMTVGDGERDGEGARRRGEEDQRRRGQHLARRRDGAKHARRSR